MTTPEDYDSSAIPNWRDVGGLELSGGGRIKRGVLYRSSQPLASSDAAGRLFSITGVRTVYDLRTDMERSVSPDQLPGGVSLIDLNVLGDDPEGGAAAFTDLFDASRASTVSVEMMTGQLESSYRQFVKLPSARTSYRRLLTDLAEGAVEPALIHCTAGKDRTGWAAAALQLWLGADHEEVVADYLVSNQFPIAGAAQMMDGFAKIGGDPEVVRALLSVRVEYLDAALTEVNAAYGGINEYFEAQLGLSPGQCAALRERFV